MAHFLRCIECGVVREYPALQTRCADRSCMGRLEPPNDVAGAALVDSTHTRDSECVIVGGELAHCAICGVDHSSRCPACGATGFHADTCRAEGSKNYFLQIA